MELVILLLKLAITFIGPWFAVKWLPLDDNTKAIMALVGTALMMGGNVLNV